MERIASRLTPNMGTWRPCDQVESAIAWKHAIEAYRRPDLPDLLPSEPGPDGPQPPSNWPMPPGWLRAERIAPVPGPMLIATGSEVELAVAA